MTTAAKTGYFILGVSVGFALGKLYTDRVYGKKIKEYLEQTSKLVQPVPRTTQVKVDEREKEPTNDILVGRPETSEPVDTCKIAYNRILKEESYSEEPVKRKSKYQIDADDFGNTPGYVVTTLRYFQDTEELIDPRSGEHFDVDLTIGPECKKDLDVANPYDTLYFRDEDMRIDYDVEIGEVDE